MSLRAYGDFLTGIRRDLEEITTFLHEAVSSGGERYSGVSEMSEITRLLNTIARDIEELREREVRWYARKTTFGETRNPT